MSFEAVTAAARQLRGLGDTHSFMAVLPSYAVTDIEACSETRKESRVT
jgi:hypothetical protein